ncbi:dynein light chain Tctex-type protein 2B-like [Pectinophora gossypiella]|uniref:dynein light chain Tctex-type protein 2B-like n=1 Tax=Pectinophora gossypiella TaxID=13191 RepID=UPI00214F0ED7|nr:dynein light chain Tctex-type protein 2B-like [Pectinophora gossypiella]
MADDEEVVEEQEVVPVVESDVVIVAHEEQPLAPPKYEVRPRLGQKFQAQNVRDIILSTMQEQLMGRQYRVDQVPRWCKMIANGVRQRVQDLNMQRYKIIVTTTIIETRGAGIKCAQRCIWDPETDDYADNLYRNSSIFCYTICYGVYMY